MDEEKIDELSVVLLDDLGEESMDVGVGALLEQMLGYRVIILRANFDVAKRAFRVLLVDIGSSLLKKFHKLQMAQTGREHDWGHIVHCWQVYQVGEALENHGHFVCVTALNRVK